MTMALRNFTSRVWRVISWTPANLFYRTNPVSISSYSTFHSKILRSNLKLLFINIMVIGLLMDVLFFIFLLSPPLGTKDQLPLPRRMYVFLFLSVMNIIHHTVFLMLRTKKYVVKYQYLISGASLFILYTQVNQYQLSYHQIAPVQIWASLGLLQMLMAVFYCQGSFICSMVVWFISGVWLSSTDLVFANIQVLCNQYYPHSCSHVVAVTSCSACNSATLYIFIASSCKVSPCI